MRVIHMVWNLNVKEPNVPRKSTFKLNIMDLQWGSAHMVNSIPFKNPSSRDSLKRDQIFVSSFIHLICGDPGEDSRSRGGKRDDSRIFSIFKKINGY